MKVIKINMNAKDLNEDISFDRTKLRRMIHVLGPM